MSPTCATNRWYPLQVAKACWDHLNPNEPNVQDMKDYAHYSALSASAILNHNCLQDQDNN